MRRMTGLYESIDDKALRMAATIDAVRAREFEFGTNSSQLIALAERNWRFIFAITTSIVDVAAIMAAWIICRTELYKMPYVFGRHSRDHSVILPGAVTLLFLILASIFGLYRRPYWASYSSQLRAAIKAYGFGTLLVFSLLLVKDERTLLAPIAVWLGLAAPAVLVIGRVALHQTRRRLLSSGWALERALLVLAPDEAEKGSNELGQLKLLGYDVLHQVRQAARDPDSFLAEIHRHVRQRGPNCILIPSLDLVANGYTGLVAYAQKQGLKVKLFSRQLQRILGRAFVYDVAGITIESPARFKITWIRKRVKRVLDLVAGTMLLILTAPVFLVVAVALKLESRGPLFFTQLRSVSRSAPSFAFHKFRSMRQQADSLKASLRTANETSGALFKIRNDPRITPVGKIIRRLSIDELPQLVNVLKGDMSLVGPRPLPVADYQVLAHGDAMERHYEGHARVKPGLTGLWQICGRSELGYSEMILLDLYYAENYTIFLDLEIILRTIPAVLFGRGAY
jgi:exopolysaccharide biosynthesis polyprenyl glycosylphosphotransferase